MGTELSRLKLPRGSREKKKRIGRGPGSGMGTYSTRGLKGQLARSGGGPRIGFEGGQTPLIKRVPKKGFNRRKNVRFSVINVDVLNRFKKGEEVTIDRLKQENLISKKDKVKILGNGDIDKKLTVHAHNFSKSAKEKIEKAGGEIVKDA